MFCKNCGKEVKDENEFCTECGHQIDIVTKNTTSAKKQISDNDERWWVRFLRVIYIILYIPLPFIIWGVWETYSSTYTGYLLGQSYYKNTYGKAFWYSLLAFCIYIIVIRLIKIAVRYVVIGEKPEWEKEFKKPF